MGRILPVGNQSGRSSDTEDAVGDLHGFVSACIYLGGDVLAADDEAQGVGNGLQHVLGQIDAADG